MEGSHNSANHRALDIVVLFSRSADVVAPLWQSFQAIREELLALSCAIIAVNGSRDDAALEQALAAAVATLPPAVPCRIWNGQDRDPVQALNAAGRQSVAVRHDVLLLHPGATIFPGALPEIRNVADGDPLVGFVRPRSNEGSVGRFPTQKEFRDLGPVESYAIFSALSQYLPVSHAVPAGAGCALFIKYEVLAEFGHLGEAYDDATELIMRANRCGYRSALANRAFVHYERLASSSTDSPSEPISETKNVTSLQEHYPEYAPALSEYLDGAHHEAEGLLSGLLPDQQGRLDLVFDLSAAVPKFNGTFEVCREILTRAPRLWTAFNIYVMASEEIVKFHRLDELDQLFFVSPSTQRRFAMAFRFGQPFDYESLFRMGHIAALNVYAMLDPIAYDCLYLNMGDLDALWGTVFMHSDGVVYISDFAREQFRRRFCVRAGLPEVVTYLSLDYRDYVDQDSCHDGEAGHILVIGNQFEHKRVPATVDALSRALPLEKIVALGLPDSHWHNVDAYPSGNLSEEHIDQLMRGARFVVFPSLYEGFGIPVVKSLAYGKPVLARRIPTNFAIQKKLSEFHNLELYSSTEDLVERLQKGFPIWQPGESSHGDPSAGWDGMTEQLGSFLSKVIEAFSFNDVLVPRLKHLRSLEQREQLRRELREARAQLVAQAPPPAQVLPVADKAAADRSAQLASELIDREGQIRKIYGSWSWRLTSPLRYLVDLYLRARTRR